MYRPYCYFVSALTFLWGLPCIAFSVLDDIPNRGQRSELEKRCNKYCILFGEIEVVEAI